MNILNANAGSSSLELRVVADADRAAVSHRIVHGGEKYRGRSSSTMPCCTR